MCAQANMQLSKAAWIQSAAQAFINQRFGGEPFLAVHVRPYPDTCLQVGGRVVFKGNTYAIHAASTSLMSGCCECVLVCAVCGCVCATG